MLFWFLYMIEFEMWYRMTKFIENIIKIYEIEFNI